MQRELDTGIDMEFDAAGSGSAVVLLHGFPHNRSLWRHQLPALSTHNSCIVPDLRGYGGSSVQGPWSMAQFADDVAALITSLGLTKAVIVGLSMGGYVALQMWRSHPELISGLVLMDTQAGADSSEGKSKRDASIELVRTKGVDALAEAALPGMLGKSTRDRNPALVAEVLAMLRTAPEDGVVGSLEAMRDRADSTSTLASITVPTLIVVGEEDVLTPVKEAEKMHAAIPGSLLEVVPEAGHLSNLENPDLVNDLLQRFLSEIKASSGVQ